MNNQTLYDLVKIICILCVLILGFSIYVNTKIQAKLIDIEMKSIVDKIIENQNY